MGQPISTPPGRRTAPAWPSVFNRDGRLSGPGDQADEVYFRVVGELSGFHDGPERQPEARPHLKCIYGLVA
jgi:hypothetical protein